MDKREKTILDILTKNPLAQQHEIAKVLGISRSRVAGHIMNMINKGVIKGKGYILNKRKQCVIVGAMIFDVIAAGTKRQSGGSSSPAKIGCHAGGVGRNIAHNLAMLDVETHLISVVGDDFYGSNILEQTIAAGVNVQGCSRIYGRNTATYISIHDSSGSVINAVNDTGIMDDLTPSMLIKHKELFVHSEVIVADCNLSEDALEWIFIHAGETPVFVMPVSEFKVLKIKKWLSKIDTIILSVAEIFLMSDGIPEKKENLELAIESVGGQGVKNIYILDDTGLLAYHTERKTYFINDMNKKVISYAEGIDNAFMAGLIFSYIHNLELDEKIELSQICAFISGQQELVNSPNFTTEHLLHYVSKSWSD